jgi:Tol biopolymer transport system component/DNA-binding winged helix-turn-helix (wHTH) protein
VNGSVRQPVYVFEGFRLDTQRRLLFATDGQPVELTPRLFDALLHLVERRGELATKEELVRKLWPNVVVEEHNLNKVVSELRRALGESPGEHKFIVTKPGRGYRFVAGVSVEGVSSGASAATVRTEAGGRSPPAAPRRSVTRAAVAAGLALLAVSVAIVASRGFGPSQPQLTLTPWATDRGGQRGPVWSPDGSATAFVARRSVNEPFELYVRELSSPVAHAVARLTGTGVVIAAPARWTTGGKLLYWAPPGLWSVSPIGASSELVATIDFDGLGVMLGRTTDVTRDGSTLAAVRRADGSVGVSIARLPAAEFEEYEPAPFAATALFNIPALRFSPDGSQLLLMWNTGRGEEAWLLPFPADASRPPRRVLEALPTGSGTPEFSWLPDSRHIVVSTGEDLRRGLYIADTRTGRFRLFSSGHAAQAIPVVSPDGKRLVFTDIEAAFDIVTLNLDDATVTPLIATDRAETMPSWAPNGSGLVYVTDRAGAWEIWLHQPPMADRPIVTARDFPTETLFLMSPTLSPDGRRVIYQRVEGPGARSSQLWMSALVGGAPERVTTDDIVELAGSWSPDGAWYAYRALEGTGQVLKKVRTTGRADSQTLRSDVAQSFWLPIWSPDGQWILAAHAAGDLVTADGRISRDLRLGTAACAFGLRSDAFLHCIRGPQADGRHELVALDADGAVVRTIGWLLPEHLPAAPQTPSLRLSPARDGAQLAYSIGAVHEHLWRMEGLETVALP